MVQAALVVAEKMQQDRTFWFRLSQGDKDTFVSRLSALHFLTPSRLAAALRLLPSRQPLHAGAALRCVRWISDLL